MTVVNPAPSFPAKYVAETVFLPPVSFANQLSEGDTIAEVTVTATLYSGGPDGDPGAILISTTNDGVSVIQKVAEGVGGSVYKLLYTVTTTKSESFEQEWFLPVVTE